MSDDEDAEAQAMAAAMGFSSFGTAPPKKKRKFNAATDSFIDGQELEKVDRGGKKGKGSGGNEVPLGKVRTFGGGARGSGENHGSAGGGQRVREDRRGIEPELEAKRGRINEEEIDLDLDEDDDEEDNTNGGVPLNPVRRPIRVSEERSDDEDGPQYEDTSLPPPISSLSDGPAYIDTSLPPPSSHNPRNQLEEENPEAAEMQARIDSILASIQPPPGSEPSSLAAIPDLPIPSNSGVPGTEISPYSVRSRLHPPPSLPSGLPSRPVFSPGSGRGGGAFSDAGSVNTHSSTTTGRVRGEELWYIGYFDPSFNQNPWERLEKERGLESVGSWIERVERG